jgi:endonuclease/exonuclease/phosphatase family metal-dependent hydrolase
MASRPGCGQPRGNLFKRIDYVFTKGLDVVSTTRFARPEPGADAPSDHAGVTAEIAWPAAATR